MFELLALVQTLAGDYKMNFDPEYSMDPDVIDCQFNLYMVMLMNPEDENYEKQYEEFEKSYNKLSLDKKNFIKEDFKNILNEQDKHEKEKEKIL